MAIKVIMPRLTHDMQSGIFIRWLVQEGKPVQRGEPLFEVETDKAVTEVDAEAEGVLRGVRAEEGDTVPIGATMAYIAGEDETLPEIDEQQEVSPAVESSPAPVTSPPARSTSEARQLHGVVATPIARRMAREKGVDLSQLKGSGPRGRIIEADVRAYVAQGAKTVPAPATETALQEAPYRQINLTNMELATGRRMLQGVQTMPQFNLEIDVDMSEATRWRERFNREVEKKVSYTALLVQTVAAALIRQPRLNARLEGDTLHSYEQVNLAVAVATPQGLIAPVIRAVEGLSLAEIQEELNLLQEQSQTGRLPAGRLSGATMTISNLGMFGIDRFQALINPPETSILAIGRIREMPWVVDGEIAIRPIMTMRLTIDHRVADGATAAPFLVEVSRLLKAPYLLL
jgi:pyruvate dehydrogenase E2 component (dihydrolipoamide acetyltransferase)